MLRLVWMLIPISLVSACCRPQYGCGPFGPAGTRVPPPATGSYGAGNTYYPAAVPRSTGTPTTAPRALNPSSGWRTSTDQGSRVPSLAAGGEQATVPVESASAAATAAPAPRTDSVTVRPRLKGMPVNEALPVVAPASFDSPARDAANDAAADTAAEQDGRLAPVPASSLPIRGLPANGLRDPSVRSPIGTWQSRPAPAPNRIAGS